MTEREWLDRYRRRIMEVVGWSWDETLACEQAETFEVLSDGFDDDPEGAADEEMSYWEP
jgi:hypothetical protein